MSDSRRWCKSIEDHEHLISELEAFIKAERKAISAAWDLKEIEPVYNVQWRRETLNRLAALVRKWKKI